MQITLHTSGESVVFIYSFKYCAALKGKKYELFSFPPVVCMLSVTKLVCRWSFLNYPRLKNAENLCVLVFIIIISVFLLTNSL